MRFLAAGWCVSLLAAGSAFSQYVISSHSGVIQYVEGRAFLADKPVDPKFGQFPDIKENQEFRTEDGRAEILLTPGVFLRLGENSSLRMLSTRLINTRVEILSGSAVVESTEIPKDNAVQLVYKNASVSIQKQGIYRLDTEPARFGVYEGEATVSDGTNQVILHGGKQTTLTGALAAQSFDRKADDQDALYRWSDRRASYVAQANVASASAVGGNGYSGYGYPGYGGFNLAGFSAGGLGYGGLGLGMPLSYGCNSAFLGGWVPSPLYGMYTYMPCDGFGYSPFGYTYYSPATVVYAPSYGGSGYAYGGNANRTAENASRLATIATHRGASDGAMLASERSFGGGSFSGRGGSFSGGSVSAGSVGHSGGGHR
jgi:hypothetical protein